VGGSGEVAKAKATAGIWSDQTNRSPVWASP